MPSTDLATEVQQILEIAAALPRGISTTIQMKTKTVITPNVQGWNWLALGHGQIPAEQGTQCHL